MEDTNGRLLTESIAVLNQLTEYFKDLNSFQLKTRVYILQNKETRPLNLQTHQPYGKHKSGRSSESHVALTRST